MGKPCGGRDLKRACGERNDWRERERERERERLFEEYAANELAFDMDCCDEFLQISGPVIGLGIERALEERQKNLDYHALKLVMV